MVEIDRDALFNRIKSDAEAGYDGNDGAGQTLSAELQVRLWALFDAARAICERETPEAWAALYLAVARVPESLRPDFTRHKRER